MFHLLCTISFESPWPISLCCSLHNESCITAFIYELMLYFSYSVPDKKGNFFLEFFSKNGQEGKICPGNVTPAWRLGARLQGPRAAFQSTKAVTGWGEQASQADKGPAFSRGQSFLQTMLRGTAQRTVRLCASSQSAVSRGWRRTAPQQGLHSPRESGPTRGLVAGKPRRPLPPRCTHIQRDPRAQRLQCALYLSEQRQVPACSGRLF